MYLLTLNITCWRHSSMDFSQSYMSCWVCQKCKILTTLYNGHFSGLCLQWATLRDEVTPPSRTKSSLGYYKSGGVPILVVPQQQPTTRTASLCITSMGLGGKESCVFYQQSWNSNRPLISRVKSNPRPTNLHLSNSPTSGAKYMTLKL